MLNPRRWLTDPLSLLWLLWLAAAVGIVALVLTPFS